MSTELVSKTGSYEPDNLIAKLFPPALTFGVTIPAGTGEVKRGAVLVVTMDAARTTALLSADTTGKANAILATDVDASGDEDVVAVAYNEGNFNRGALILPDGYELTADDEESLWTHNIALTDME